MNGWIGWIGFEMSCRGPALCVFVSDQDCQVVPRRVGWRRTHPGAPRSVRVRKCGRLTRMRLPTWCFRLFFRCSFFFFFFSLPPSATSSDQSPHEVELRIIPRIVRIDPLCFFVLLLLPWSFPHRQMNPGAPLLQVGILIFSGSDLNLAFRIAGMAV